MCVRLRRMSERHGSSVIESPGPSGPLRTGSRSATHSSVCGRPAWATAGADRPSRGSSSCLPSGARHGLRRRLGLRHRLGKPDPASAAAGPAALAPRPADPPSSHRTSVLRPGPSAGPLAVRSASRAPDRRLEFGRARVGRWAASGRSVWAPSTAPAHPVGLPAAAPAPGRSEPPGPLGWAFRMVGEPRLSSRSNLVGNSVHGVLLPPARAQRHRNVQVPGTSAPQSRDDSDAGPRVRPRQGGQRKSRPLQRLEQQARRWRRVDCDGSQSWGRPCAQPPYQGRRKTTAAHRWSDRPPTEVPPRCGVGAGEGLDTQR